MAIDNRLQIFDENGNLVDYDIMAADVKFADGKDLPTKLDELEDEIGEGGYTPPQGGIPKTDLAPAVQQTLDDVAGKVDKVTGKGLSSNDYTDTDKAKVDGLKPVATSGSYNDLTDKPTIPTVPTMDSQPTAGNTTHMVSSDGVAAAIANAGSVKSVSINGNPAVYPDGNGNVNLGNVVGTQGPKGDTGNVQVDGNGNVLIVNNVDEGGTGAALSAEMGKRLALKSGTFAAAWARAQVIPVPFSFLWIENVSGVLVRKPIWHIGNSVFVDAAGGAVSVAASAVPNEPTFSETSGSTIGKNTQLTITPAADSALYYKIDNGNWIVSDSAVTISVTATCTITAKCVNNAGSSSEVQCALTVSGPQVPQFAAADGTTIGTGNVVSRGGSIVVSVPEGGELHYSTDGENYTTASGLSVTIPVPAAGVHIWAYNIEDGEQSATRDIAYTMAALAATTLSPATGEEFPAGGGSVTITATEGDGIKYTTDGSDPTSSQTATAVTALSATVNVTSRTTIKVVAYDSYGTSAVTEGSYTVETAKLKVTASAATTMTLTKTDDSTVALTIAQGDNEFEIDTDLGGVTTFKSCAFGDKTLITKIDFGGITINSIAGLFQNCASLLECKNLFVNGSAANAFNGCTNIAKNDKSQLSLGGVITSATYMLNQGTTRPAGGGVDLSRVTSISNIAEMFCKFCGSAAIDLSHTVVNIGNDNWNNMNETFFLAKASTLIIGKFDAPANSSHVNTFSYSSITTIKCTDPTPPALGTDWVADFKTVAGSSAKILVPNDYLEDYKAAAGWSNYADIMKGY